MSITSSWLSKWRSRFAKYTLIGTTTFTLCVGLALCFEIDSPLKHYQYPPNFPASPNPFESWADVDITYTVVGNISREVNLPINSFMEMIAHHSGLRIGKAVNAKIYMIYEDSIFDQLMNDQSKLKSVGFPDNLLEVSKAKFIDHKSLNCLSQVNVDQTGNINSAFVMSKKTSPECIKPMLYEVFGLYNIDSDIVGMSDVCILYNARTQGLRTAEEIEPRLSTLEETCSQSQINKNVK